jgi:hypothetical protein
VRENKQLRKDLDDLLSKLNEKQAMYTNLKLLKLNNLIILLNFLTVLITKYPVDKI